MSQPGQVVVWWPTADADHRVPRQHCFRWALADGTRQGQLLIDSPYRRLNRDYVEQKLDADLAGVIQAPREIRLADEALHLVDPVVRLAVAGHAVKEADLASAYGVDVLAGVTAQLRGKGVDATVIIESTLSRPLCRAVAEWAIGAIGQFAHAGPDELLTTGWQLVAAGRWQLLARQVRR